MPSDDFRFFVFTCRDPATDFRAPLVDALRCHYETHYIWLRRHPVISTPDGRRQEMSLAQCLRFIRGFRPDGKTNVYFNSTNTYFPVLSVILRRIAARGIWCFDMHDDLRYHNTGIKRWREERIIAMLRRLAHITVHAAPTLQELFPDSRHLGNASNILPMTLEPNDPRDVLIIASFDERFDFDFLGDLARLCPDRRFHLHGWTRPQDTATMGRIRDAAAAHPNIHYHGPYKMAELPAILRRYRVSVAPYLTDSVLTRYIDPLRFYHCLNAGLEMISTDIPQARYMRDSIHVVADATACAETLAALDAGQRLKQPAYTPVTWEQQAERLVDILRGIHRA